MNRIWDGLGSFSRELDETGLLSGEYECPATHRRLALSHGGRRRFRRDSLDDAGKVAGGAPEAGSATIERARKKKKKGIKGKTEARERERSLDETCCSVGSTHLFAAAGAGGKEDWVSSHRLEISRTRLLIDAAAVAAPSASSSSCPNDADL